MKFVKGELVMWVASHQDKFWGIVGGVRKDSMYLVSDSSGFWLSLADIRPTTVEKVIRYQRRRWQKSAKETRASIKYAQSLVKSVR